MSWEYKPLEERIKKPGWLETAARDVGGSLAQVVGSVGQAANQLHLGVFQTLDDYFGENHPNIRKIFETGRNIGKSLKDWGTEVKSVIPNQPEFQNRALTDLLTDTNFLTSPYGLWHNVWEGVGSSLPFMAVGGGLMKAGFKPATWIGGAAKNALSKTQAGQKLLDLGGRFANTKLGGVLSDMASGGANYGLVSAIPDAMANSAELIKPLKDRGFSDSEIAQLMQKSIAHELPMDIAANAGAFGSIIPSAGGTVHHAIFGRDYNNPPQPSQDTPETSQPSSNGSLIDWVHKQRGITGKDETIKKIIAEVQRQGVDPKLAVANGIIESSLDQSDISDAGAIGVMQLMPETARELGVDPYNEDQNIEGGIRFLKQMLNQFNGDWRLAFAAYNAGEGAVNKFGGIPPYSETQAYVPGVLGIYGSKVNQTTTQQTQQQTSQRQGNILDIKPQTGKNCIREAMAAIYNAYTGENTTVNDWDFCGSNWWYSNLKNGKLQAKEYNFSSSDRTQFEQTIKDHFDKNPNNPIYLYQANGAGSGGNHKLNRGLGTHATIIGKKSASKKQICRKYFQFAS